jgi:glutamate synthase domain-containing protein 3
MGKKVTLDANGVYYRQLNEQIRDAVRNGAEEIELLNVRGQRYIGNAIDKPVRFTVNGVPGQDMAAFMRGAFIRVEGNAQDGVANTMDDGQIEINGMAGDVLGYGMRGGRVMVKQDVGYRVGIHMKAYMDKSPVIVAGGKAGDFLGEYMAGGAIILLGMDSTMPVETPITGRSLGTGMHGGVIYIRGDVPEYQLGPGLSFHPLEDEDIAFIRKHVEDWASAFGKNADEVMAGTFRKVQPFSKRPYGNMYVGTN